jgi:hypothetical protein
MPQSLWWVSTAHRDVVANGADAADARGVVFGPRAYPDRSCSRSPLAAERYFNAQHAKERLRTTQPAGESTRIFGPARAFFRGIVTGNSGGGTQEIRGRSHPAPAFRHEFPDTKCHGVCLGDAFDCGFISLRPRRSASFTNSLRPTSRCLRTRSSAAATSSSSVRVVLMHQDMR